MESFSEGSPPISPKGISIKDRISKIWHKWKTPPGIVQPEANNPLYQESTEPEINIPVQVYVGLEQIDELKKDVPLLQDFLKHSQGERRDSLARKLALIDAKRREILDRYDLQPLIDADLEDQRRGYPNYKYHLPISDAKGIVKLLIKQAAKKLPPLTKEGYIRMYRGEGPHPGTTDDNWKGTWFAHDLNQSASYPLGKLDNSRVIFVDIPEASLREYHADNKPELFGASKGGEYLLPRETVAKAKEFIRFLTVNTKGDPWNHLVQTA